MKHLFLILFLLFAAHGIKSQSDFIKGEIKDQQTGEPVIGATVVIKGSTSGALTDLDGKFQFVCKEALPVILTVSFMGYENQEFKVSSFSQSVKVKLKLDSKLLDEFEISESSLTDEDIKNPLSMEKMDLKAIKQCAAGSFYEGLGQMKGVDMTTASLGFTIINTRGFNSTSPVRTLQLIDGVDNAAPGLGFSLGNFLGASELDIQKVEIISGANSATHGPNAFNGVINMTTKDPFLHQGLDVRIKGAERNMFEGALRFARKWQIQERDVFAVKFNAYYMEALDWEADNMDSTQQSTVDHNNFGGYDAVNIYGDEKFITANSSFSPGLGSIYRTGYQEKDLVDYNTRNLKLSGSAHYKLTENVEALYGYNMGFGTTVYQAFNRMSLKDILFQQHKAEIKQKDKFFIRSYFTSEDAGNSYDAVLAANQLQNSAKSWGDWVNDYLTYWNGNVKPEIQSVEGWPQLSFGVPFDFEKADSILATTALQDSLSKWHTLARHFADSIGNPYRNNLSRFKPGTAEFDSALTAIITNPSVPEGGAKLFDKSALWHIQGEFTQDLGFATLKAGGNYRKYLPYSEGRLFEDTLYVNPETGDSLRNKINSWEVGSFVSLQKKMMEERLIASAAVRGDWNNNIGKLLISPTISLVYDANEKNTFRINASSAVRNPTLGDQFLYYDLGSAIILGNTNGYDSLVTTESLIHFLETNLTNRDTLAYFNVAPLVPEQVKSIEFGHRASLWNNKLFLDYNYYFSWYKNFIGYKFGATIPRKESPTVFDVYRVTANAPETVTTQGFNLGCNYYLGKYYSISANYSWNVLNQKDSVNAIIPAFNTPKNKYNLGIKGSDIHCSIGNLHLNNWGFGLNYKWVQSFQYEGSPQFTGVVPSYSFLDAQVNVKVTALKSTIKIGASNILNNKQFTVYGGPRVGRMGYASVTFEL